VADLQQGSTVVVIIIHNIRSGGVVFTIKYLLWQLLYIINSSAAPFPPLLHMLHLDLRVSGVSL
jgi:hypothetical protein